ncbi:hypothetical protein B484DRAFT_404457 [Ochromonadaceae sp. CCMP2298]|nr:hypothetical protein B484DRAFT_404457 [Ochromonadaceae sp. CCMP2298]
MKAVGVMILLCVFEVAANSWFRPDLLSQTISQTNADTEVTKVTKVTEVKGVKEVVKEAIKDTRPALRVVTDIDDTVVSSGGHRLGSVTLGGLDNQFLRGAFYPGVMQFGLELSRALSPSARNADGVPGERVPKMAVLTARAREFKLALALKPSGKKCRTFRKAGEANGLSDWGIGDVYYGSVKEWIISSRKGKRKYKNFQVLMRDDAERGLLGCTQYIIVGDTGERDEEAAERAIATYPDKVRAVFLHSVSKYQTRSPVPADREINGVPVFYFRTYVGAAAKAHRAGILSQPAAERVAAAAVGALREAAEQAQRPMKWWQVG